MQKDSDARGMGADEQVLPTPRCLLARSSAGVTGQGVQVTGVAEVCDPLCSPRVSGCVRLSCSGAK